MQNGKSDMEIESRIGNMTIYQRQTYRVIAQYSGINIDTLVTTKRRRITVLHTSAIRHTLSLNNKLEG